MNGDSPWKAMILLAAGTLFAMGLWFSASAVVPVLSKIWTLSESTAAWLTLSVQIGFVFGTLLSAILNLSDIINARRFMTLCAIAAAICNALFAMFANGAESAIFLRCLTGIFLAGVYPPAMKIMASWFRSGRGMAIGVLIGALTFGKATPYLINAFQMNSWRNTLMISSALTILGALAILFFLKDGPYTQSGARFDWSQVGKVFTNRSVRLANFGYLGHMWELYAMWTWTPVMIRASFSAHHLKPEIAETISFAAIAAGAIGCIIAGVLADRYGRTLIASAAMVISGACCLLVGFLFQNPIWLIIITLIWGISVVADSAQFSASVTELADQRYIGTALTLQTCLGFLLTVITIKLIPIVAASFGWRYAFWLLAPGPFLGVLAMLRLRRLPEALRIAEGKR
jgi:MFS family permease